MTSRRKNDSNGGEASTDSLPNLWSPSPSSIVSPNSFTSPNAQAPSAGVTKGASSSSIPESRVLGPSDSSNRNTTTQDQIFTLSKQYDEMLMTITKIADENMALSEQIAKEKELSRKLETELAMEKGKNAGFKMLLEMSKPGHMADSPEITPELAAETNVQAKILEKVEMLSKIVETISKSVNLKNK